MEKTIIRQQMLARRNRVAAADARRASTVIISNIESLIPPGSVVAGYVATRGELDIAPALEALHAKGVMLALPKALAGGSMEFLVWAPGDALERDVCGMLSPAAHVQAVPDVVLVPMLAFDAARHRLGYGGGYYDRALAARPVKTIGIAYACQMVDKLPREAHDVPLDVVVTEQGLR